MKNLHVSNLLGFGFKHNREGAKRISLLYLGISLRHLLTPLLLLTLSVGQIWGTNSQRIIFFKPSNKWKEASAYFDVHYWQNSNSSNNGDVTMTESNNSGVYYAFIPDWADRVLFYRRNPADGNEWAKTSNQTVENWYGQCNMTAGDDSWETGTSWDNTTWWNTYTIYFDDTETGFTSGTSTPKLRVGTTVSTTKDDMTLVTGTQALYKQTKAGGDWDAYHAFCFANAAGATGSNSIYDRGAGEYNITKQTEYIRGSLKGNFTFIGRSGDSYYHNDDKCMYYSTEIFYGIKTYTVTNTSVSNGTVELFYQGEDGTWHTIAAGSSAEVLPTTIVYLKATPDAGKVITGVKLTDVVGSNREWDASGTLSKYVVRSDVTFTASFGNLEKKTILVKDDGSNNWAPMYFKGWNPFVFESKKESHSDYSSKYHIVTQKMTNTVTLCGDTYYVIEMTNEYPYYYIHNENDAQRTKFFKPYVLTNMGTYSNQQNYTDISWSLCPVACSDHIYYVKTTTAGGTTYYSNIVSNTTDIMSFYAPKTDGSVELVIDGTKHTIDKTVSAWTSLFDTTNGAVFTAKTDGTGLTDVAIYEGDYHIHVNATTRNYLTAGASKEGTTGTQFTKFEKNALFGDTYDHYWVDWFLGSEDGYSSQSVVATVGNEYNANLAGILGADDFAPKGMTQSAGGNVRYGYDPETNAFTRAIVAAGDAAVTIKSDASSKVIVSNDGGSTYTQDASTARYFADATNWNYQVFAQVKGQATATASTSYVAGIQTLAEDKKLIGGSSESTYTVVITYDFKTNRFIAAWKPGTSFEGFELESNLMVVRTENGAPTVLNLTTENTALSKITKIYTVMELLQDNWKDDDTKPYANRRIDEGGYCDEYYWISLPYKCCVGDIFGIEGYGPNGSWVMQTYHGDYRAAQGWWAETASWWYDMDRTDTLQANQGYVLRVTNLDGDHGGTKRFKGTSGGKLYLYFPSSDNDVSLERLGNSTTTTTKEHKCDKVRDAANHAGDPEYDRRTIDSNWNIIGSPSFNDAKITDGSWGTGTYPTSNITGTLKYFFTWSVSGSPAKGTFTVQDAQNYQFHGTHAYLAQYAGTINWEPYTNNSTNPLVGLKAPARYNEDTIGEQTLRLVLKRNGEQADVTFISRMAEGATEGYDLNMDLSKLLSSSGNNLYTLAGYYKMAGNCLPDTVKTVPVGLKLAHAGEYTFAMPDGTNGTGVYLIDKLANTRTNLSLTDYTVNLEAGENNGRFSLELSPIANTPTGMETITGKGLQVTGASKRLVDGVLYIIRDGEVFDARGARVK